MRLRRSTSFVPVVGTVSTRLASNRSPVLTRASGQFHSLRHRTRYRLRPESPRLPAGCTEKVLPSSTLKRTAWTGLPLPIDSRFCSPTVPARVHTPVDCNIQIRSAWLLAYTGLTNDSPVRQRRQNGKKMSDSALVRRKDPIRPASRNVPEDSSRSFVPSSRGTPVRFFRPCLTSLSLRSPAVTRIVLQDFHFKRYELVSIACFVIACARGTYRPLLAVLGYRACRTSSTKEGRDCIDREGRIRAAAGAHG